MRIFLDTADIDEIREVARWGILSGVTTNPTLMSKTSGMSHEDVIKHIAGIVDGPISAETISLDANGMLDEGRRFAKWHPNVVIKVPSTPAGCYRTTGPAETIRSRHASAAAVPETVASKAAAPSQQAKSSLADELAKRLTPFAGSGAAGGVDQKGGTP